MRPVPGIVLAMLTSMLASCGGGGSGADTAPDPFAFMDQAGVAKSTVIVSNAVTITGIAAPARVTVMGGEYSIGCGAAFTSMTGEISNGDIVCVRQTSAATPGTAVGTRLSVGGVTDTFTTTTVAGPLIALSRAFPALSFSRPVALLQAPGDDTRWFVVQQSGVVRVFANNAAVNTSSVFIDISALVGDSSGEQGLYNLVFDPAFAVNGRAYLSFTRSAPTLTSYVSRFTSADGGLTLDPASETVVLTLAQPFSNHNGGSLAFGPDGFLYAGFGDGGSSNDPGNRAQDTTSLFGTIIRINVAALPYTIPAGNPFAGNPRCDTGTSPTLVNCPEIFAWGLRNPWRLSFDSFNGDLWAGDVGQDAWEEVDVIENGRNYGWRDREGAHCNAFYYPVGGCVTAGLTDPVAEYDHGVGESITGGYVYRGSQDPPLEGSYLFGDFISGRIFRLAPGSAAVEELLDTGMNIASFGEAIDGEVYAVDYGGGTLQQIIAAP